MPTSRPCGRGASGMPGRRMVARPPRPSGSTPDGSSRRSSRASTRDWSWPSCRWIASSTSRPWPTPSAAGGRRWPSPDAAERATGYVLGGISPIGTRRTLADGARCDRVRPADRVRLRGTARSAAGTGPCRPGLVDGRASSRQSPGTIEGSTRPRCGWHTPLASRHPFVKTGTNRRTPPPRQVLSRSGIRPTHRARTPVSSSGSGRRSPGRSA